MLNQLSVFIENKPGRLFQLSTVLAENKIDLLTLSIADTKDYGILRAITRENERAVEVLKEAGFTVSITKLIAVEVADEPGGLRDILAIFEREEMSIEYLYSYARTKEGTAIILMKVEDAEAAVRILQSCKVKLIDSLL